MSNRLTLEEINYAQELFEKYEPRSLFYRAATELIDLAIQGKTEITVGEALSVLLQTWNRAYYYYHGGFTGEHLSELERILRDHYSILISFRKRTIESLSNEDEALIRSIFSVFEEPLGAVGAAKCLHLMAPRFFPLWDRSIAKAYSLSIQDRGRNADRYYRFMKITEAQWIQLGGEDVIGRNPLKAIDEYNYCTYTLPKLQKHKSRLSI